MIIKNLSILFLLLLVSVSCAKTPQPTTPKTDSVAVHVPVFNADSAYLYIKTQVDFGARVPNSPAHKACGDYLVREMTRHDGKITVQAVDLHGHDGKTLKARNIVAAYNPEADTRILLLSHWDCRPTSDADANPENRSKPVDGANDGASGVGVLMEIARQLAAQQPEVGVDILFVDMEDYGISGGEDSENTWCLGSQYWARTPHVAGYRARFGILLDMVGAPDAVFPKEGYSATYAPHVQEKVWAEAKSLGYGQFLNRKGGYITDDHVPVNQIIGIPTIDIIHFDENGFGHYWHTQQDNMTNIDRNTLKAVGQTLLNVIYKEKK